MSASNPNADFWGAIARLPEENQRAFFGASKDLNLLIQEPQPQKAPGLWDSIVEGANNGATLYARANDPAGIVEAGSFLYGALQGDFNQNPTTAQIIVGGVLSMFPVVDQICDGRDLVANTLMLCSPDEREKDENWLALALTCIGFVPVAGSAVKTVAKCAREEKQTLLPLLKVMEGLETLAAAGKMAVPWGRAPIGWLESFSWAAAADEALGLALQVFGRMRQLAVDSEKLIPLIRVRAGLRQLIETIDIIKARLKQAMQKMADCIAKRVKQLLEKKNTIGRHTATPGATNTHAQKKQPGKKPRGDYCEMKSYAYMAGMGYDLISCDLDIPQGLDGVFEHDGESPGRNVPAGLSFDPVSSRPPPYPKYVILEAKYDGNGKPRRSKKGKLKNTKTGRQGSRKYVEGKRLNDAVNDEEKAYQIRKHADPKNPLKKGPESWMFVCLGLSSVMFIDIRKKWPDLYNSEAKPAKQAGQGQPASSAAGRQASGTRRKKK